MRAALALFVAALPAAAAPPSLPLDTAFRTFSSPGDQSWPSIGAHDGGWFVTWDDHRVGAQYVDVYGTRISLAGAVLDAEGLSLASGPQDQTTTGTACNQGVCISAWSDDFTDARFTRTTAGLNDVLISPSTLNANALDGAYYVTTTPTDEGFFSPWLAGSNNLVGRRVSRTGALITGEVQLTPGPVTNVIDVAAASAGPTVLVAACDGTAGTGVTVVFMALGFSPAAPITLSAASPMGVGVASDGAGYLVAYTENGGATYGQRIDASGAVIAGPVTITTTGMSVSPAVAWDGAAYVVATFEGGDLRLWRVDGAGAPTAGLVQSSFGAPDEGKRRMSALAYSGGVGLAAWRVEAPGDSDIVAQRVTWDTAIDPAPFPVMRTGSGHRRPVAAFDGISRFLVAVSESVGASLDVRARFVGARGQPQGLAMIDIAPAPASVRTVTHDGRGYVISWLRYVRAAAWELHVTRVSSDGAVVIPDVLLTTAVDVGSPVAAVRVRTGEVGLVWTEGYVLTRARVFPDAGIAGPSPLPMPGAPYAPALAPGAGFVCLAWHDFFDYSFRAAVLNSDLGIASSTILLSQTALETRGDPAVASDGDDCLAVWSEVHGIPGSDELYVRRFATDAGLLDAQPVQLEDRSFTRLADRRSMEVTAAFDGQDYLVGYHTVTDGGRDLFYRTFTPAGAIGPRVTLAETPEHEEQPSLTAGLPGTALAAWVAFERTGPGAMRARIAVVGDAGVDAGNEPNDGGPTDAGPNDAGPNDAGPNDGGPNDGGPNDGGPNDGGPNDGGPVTTAPPPMRVGCACSADGSSTGLALLILLIGTAAARRHVREPATGRPPSPRRRRR